MADTFLHFKKLEAAGFTRIQAEAQVEMIRDFSAEKFPTKVDVEKRFAEMERHFDKLESELSRMGDRITIRLGGMMIVGFSALAALIKLA